MVGLQSRGARVACRVLPLVWALGACTFDTAPELLEGTGRAAQPQSGAGAGNGSLNPLAPSMGNGTGGTQPFNPVQLTPSDFTSGGAMQVSEDAFGLSCANVPCPIAPAATMQCCTGEPDVQARIARAWQRCGLDFGDGRCHELEQSGVTDDRCESKTPLDAVAEEAGCCTEQGLCGTLNVSPGLGCRYSGDAPPVACGADLIDESVTCQLAGVYAIRVRVDVAWGGNSGGLFDLTDAGRGFIEIYLRAEIDEIGPDMSFEASVLPCGAELPPFYSSILCESYAPIFPERIWDEGEVPLLPVAGRVQCLHPGCVLTLDAATGLIGIDLEHPEGPWPSAQQTTSFACPSGTGLDCFLDHDRDSLPGVTVELLTSGRATGVQGPPNSSCNGVYDYSGAPLNANPFAIVGGVRRADRLQLGTRVRLGGSGRIGDDCMSGLGGGLADFVQSRAAGCYAQQGTANPFEALAGPDDACDEAEALFMNQNLPSYFILGHSELPPPELSLMGAAAAPSEGPQFALVRLGDVDTEVSCKDVRAAAF